MTLIELLEKYGKRCPKCNSGQISSNNSDPLIHKCLDCDHVFPDSEVVFYGHSLIGKTPDSDSGDL